MRGETSSCRRAHRRVAKVLVALWLTTGLAISVGGAFAGGAGAEPFNMAPVPPQVPEAIDGVLPAAPYPHLARIPQRAVAPGFSHRVQERREATLPSPTGDPFFDRWSPDLASMDPGRLIASRDVTWPAGLLLTVPISSARQIKFATTDAVGLPSFGTATIVVPKAPWTRGGPRPILVNNIPIDSLGAACTPGVALAHGYTVIIPDHQGPRMAYAEPTTAGHIVLDSLRAASHLDEKRYGASRIALTGYSGGAIATNGAVKLAASYAPDIAPRIVGAALGGVPADFQMLVGSMNANLATGLFHAATFGIARERPEMLTMANHFAQWLATSPLKNVCVIPEALAGQTFFPMQLMANDPDPFHSPIAERIYRVTKMATTKSVVPLYIYQGTYEWWIPAAGARNLYREQCGLGANARYREVFGEHASGAILGFGEAVSWLDDRLEGKPARSGCR